MNDRPHRESIADQARRLARELAPDDPAEQAALAEAWIALDRSLQASDAPVDADRLARRVTARLQSSRAQQRAWAVGALVAAAAALVVAAFVFNRPDPAQPAAPDPAAGDLAQHPSGAADRAASDPSAPALPSLVVDDRGFPYLPDSLDPAAPGLDGRSADSPWTAWELVLDGQREQITAEVADAEAQWWSDADSFRWTSWQLQQAIAETESITL